MKSRIHILYPFDLGLEVDFKGRDAAEFLKSISQRKINTPVMLPESTVKLYADSEILTSVYKFGVGLIQIKLSIEGELGDLAKQSFLIERVRVGKTPLLSYCRSLTESIISRAEKFAVHRYDMRLPDAELFVITEAAETIAGVASKFIDENKRVIFGILSGEQDYNLISHDIIKREEQTNLGYYENEIIFIKRFGAFVSSSDSDTIIETIKLALCQFWSLKSYNFIMDKELDNALMLLEEMPPYYKFWRMPQAYHRFSEEALDFDKDKIAIVDSIYNVMVNIPKVEADWHLKTIHKNVNKVFDIEDFYKTVEMKIERIEESYNAARDYLATNFFILLDIIFFLSLAWSIFDTILLFTIARK